ncbi:hypothetical protein [Candidatus Finniella inopinata]|uniref:Dienelactone hydrolase domain-containing protein n=1 Tax=Candidatus Finniella inopinata TaxID=1696036 RepID=A0A4Q7DK28_9PROT|nr:hypothetical protein [Candidatus Finniella inopinata]RZI47112.1 hypothetical protein EQU50_00580 [Candidatus Finniella inopinata]
MSYLFLLRMFVGFLSCCTWASGSFGVEEIKDYDPAVGRLEHMSLRTGLFLFDLSHKFQNERFSRAILSYLPLFLPEEYTIPCISNLETEDLRAFRRLFEPRHQDISVEKTWYRYNIAFKSPRVPKDILSTDIPRLRDYVRGFSPDQWTNADSIPWYDSKGACYKSYLMTPPERASIKGGIVWLHGSSGPEPSTISKCRHFVEKGYVVLLPNLFPSFGVTSTATDQLKIPLENSILAAYRALHLLKSSPYLGGKPIALMGESLLICVQDIFIKFTYHLGLHSTDLSLLMVSLCFLDRLTMQTAPSSCYMVVWTDGQNLKTPNSIFKSI